VPIRADLAFSTDDPSFSVGRKRIRLLEAIAREGSISAAARSVGITYKTAWDWVSAMNNLFGWPLVEAHVGGRSGGGAQLSPAGRRVVTGFERIDGELTRLMRTLEPELNGTGISAANLVCSFLMRTSPQRAQRHDRRHPGRRDQRRGGAQGG
jgi:molybdate transport system regulatory protein